MNTPSKRALAVAAILVGLMAGVALLSRDSAAPTTGGPSRTASLRVTTSQSTRSPAATALTAIPVAPTPRPAATLGGERIGAWPALSAPAGNGLIAYSSDGNIFVGDPVTGTATAIVTGPSNDTRPIFSPDGLRIAFLRAKSLSETSIVVIRSDGSDERVVMDQGFARFLGGFAWTPDSTSIVVNYDSPTSPPHGDGQLSLLDASGLAEARLLTPPLPAQIGASYFSINDPVAPMFRPPNGDQIVGEVDGVISLVDIDGTRIEGFAPPSLTEFEPYILESPAWSPDGSMIAFDLSRDASRAPRFKHFGLFVLNADGSDVRRFGLRVVDRSWSPDAAKIAREKRVRVSGSPGEVIAILDVRSGVERVLDATSAVVKEQASSSSDPAAFQTLSIRTFHDYAYEGWSWTPDGRGIVVLERHGTRPFFVDIETGQVTELPWEVDGAVSWQRVPGP